MAHFQNLKTALEESLKQTGTMIVSRDSIRELITVKDDVECPYCATWFPAEGVLDEEVSTMCPNCGKWLSVSVVQYLVASDFME